MPTGLPMSDGLSRVLPGFVPPGQGGPEGTEPSRGRRSRNRERKRKQKKRRRSVTVLLVTLAVVAVSLLGAYFGLAPLARKLSEPDDYTGGGTSAVMVKVPEGASGQRIAGLLASAGVIKTQQAFLDAWNANPKSGQIRPGTYPMKKQMSSASALALMLDTSNIITHTVTVPEGMRAQEIYDLLAKKLKLDRKALAQAATSGGIGLPAAAKNNPEGFLFPATYTFPPDVAPAEALAAMVARGQQTYMQLGISDAQLRSVIIQASIVQAEAGRDAYMGPIARVLANRLAKREKLELDSTISYFTHRFGITTTSKERATPSPYNTYLNVGLPAGPISNPGEKAIAAVLKPPPGKWLFFVTVNPQTGETKFANDATTHAKYVKEFQDWLAHH